MTFTLFSFCFCSVQTRFYWTQKWWNTNFLLIGRKLWVGLCYYTFNSNFSTKFPTKNVYVKLKTKCLGEPYLKSTCVEAFLHCEESDSCRWHLSELKTKCTRPTTTSSSDNHCEWEQCAKVDWNFPVLDG